MIDPQRFVRKCISLGMDSGFGVPDSLLKNLLQCLQSEVEFHCEITSCEGSAVALASAHQVATGEVPIVFMQNSGLGNAINPITSLANSKVYSIPMVIIIGWRGRPGVPDEPQHRVMGKFTDKLLDLLNIPYFELSSKNRKNSEQVLAKAQQEATRGQHPVALLVHENTFLSTIDKLETSVDCSFVDRPSTIEGLIKLIPDSIFVATTGHTSRELFAARVKNKLPSGRDFLMVGSMGYANHFASKLAEIMTDEAVVCLDGDGALLMHMGGLARVKKHVGKNYLHIVFNNNAHASVGGGSTEASNIDFYALGQAFGYETVESVATEKDFFRAVNRYINQPSLSLIEVKCSAKPLVNLPRPVLSPQQSLAIFKNSLN